MASHCMGNDLTPNQKKELTMLQVAKSWHMKIASELENPVLPENVSDSVRKTKIEEIKRQREKHLAYSQALDALTRVRKHQLKGQG